MTTQITTQKDMYSNTGSMLKKTAQLGLFTLAGLAAIPMTQAALSINFQENTADGTFTVTFSGSSEIPSGFLDILPYNPALGASLSYVSDKDYTLYTLPVEGEACLYQIGTSPNPTDFPPFTSFPNNWNIVEMGGTRHSGISSSGSVFIVYADTSDGQLNWDSYVTVTGSLSNLGLADGQSGTMVIYNDTGSALSINWSAAAVVPEPATYAAIFGAAVSGYALLRRRRAAKA